LFETLGRDCAPAFFAAFREGRPRRESSHTNQSLLKFEGYGRAYADLCDGAPTAAELTATLP